MTTLVEPLDDMRATNPASNPELLDALADDLVKAKFDLKHLLRTIFNSRAYQLSHQSTPGNKVDAANVHFTPATIGAWARAGRLQSINLGGRRDVRRGQVRALIAAPRSVPAEALQPGLF